MRRELLRIRESPACAHAVNSGLWCVSQSRSCAAPGRYKLVSMASCPYLLLEEQKTSHFPFPSVSHRCYVTGTGVLIGQGEQRTYCLVKHHALCPFFPVQAAAAIEPDTVPQSLPSATAAAPAIETLPERPPAADAVADALPESPVSAVGEALPPEAPVQPIAEPVATRELDLAAAERELRIGIRPKTAAPVGSHLTAKDAHLAPAVLRPWTPLPGRALIWAATAGVCIVVLCFAGLSVYAVSRPTTTAALTLGSFELLPGILLFLTVSSFVVVFILVALVSWARRLPD